MLTARKYYLFTLLFLVSLTSFTQTVWIDSIRTVSNLQKADTFKVQNLLGLAGAFRQFDPDSSNAYAKKSLAFSQQLNYQPGVFESEVSLAYSQMILGNFPLALEYCFKAKETSKNLTDTSSIAFTDFLLSDCYYNLGDYSRSLVYIRSVLEVVGRAYPHALYQIWPNLSELFGALHQPDSALFYAKKSLESLFNNPCKLTDYQQKCELSKMYLLLGHAFAGVAQYDSAFAYFHAGLPIAKDVYLHTDVVDDYNGLSFIFRATANTDSAVWYAKKALNEKIIKAYPVGFLKAVQMLAVIYESSDEPDSALKYLKTEIGLKDSLFNSEKAMAVQNLTNREEAKQKELIATRIQLQNRYKLYLAAAGAIALVLIAGILLRNQRQKQLQYMRNSIADDLHDDIGSTLSSISIMSELAKQQSPASSSLLEAIGESTQSLQENMSDIVWAINPANDRFENVLQRMSHFASEILDAKNIQLNFTNDASLTTRKLTMSQRKNFYLFFKEVINNAAKYSDANKIVVSITHKDRELEMNIRDNGKGFDTGRIFRGNGMNTLRKRGEELKAYFNIRSNEQAGTEVQLRFKIT